MLTIYTKKVAIKNGGMRMSKAVSKEVVKEVINELKEQERNASKHKVFRNTELLMKNYTVLKQHSDNAVYSLDQVVKDIEPMTYEKLYIDAILKSKIRTTVMVQHIDMALDILHGNAIAKGEQEISKYNALSALYIAGKTFEDIAEQYNCSTLTVRRWKNDMLKSLGLLLFGVDGLLNFL
jgi:uncharacterized protein YjcR